MRPLALASALLALALVPAGAAAKDRDAHVRVLWNSAHADVRAGGTWDARLSLLQGPGGFDPGQARPLIVVTELASGAKRQVPMVVDLPPNTFKARVAFPRAGRYQVAATRFDPRHPERVARMGPPVSIQAAQSTATDAGGATSPWLIVGAIAVLLAGSWGILRFAARGPGRAEDPAH
jgi:hypothetical protein